MTTPATVLCFGIVVADRVYEVERLPCGEGKVTATVYRETGGGIAGTAAVAIAALGGRARFCGTVGDDPAGRFLADEMARLGVDLSLLEIVPGARTPSASITVDPGGERCAVVDRGTVRATAPDPAALTGVAAVLADHRFPEASAALLAGLPRSVPGVLDGEGGDAAALMAMTAAASVPIFSRNGLHALTGQRDPEAALLSVAAPRADAVGVTLGAAGSLWRVSGKLHRVPAPPVAVRDTTGCGDVFHGAFALAMAEGQPILDAARFASAASALKARNGNGWRGMPDRADLTLDSGPGDQHQRGQREMGE